MRVNFPYLKLLKLKLVIINFCLFLIVLPLISQDTIEGKGWTIIDTSGFIHSRMLDYKTIYGYHEGAAIAYNERTWMLIDRYGNRITGQDYENIFYAGDDLWVIGVNKKYGIATSKGHILKEPKYDQLFGYSQKKFVVKKGRYYGYTDPKGEIIISPKYDEALSFNNGYAVVKKKDKYGVINHDGNFVIPPMYQQLLSYRDDLLGFSGDGEFFGYLDINNDTVIEPQFTYAASFRDGRAVVSTDPIKKRKAYLDTVPDYFYIDKTGLKADNQEDSLYLETVFNPVEIDSVNWTFVNRVDDTLFANEFLIDENTKPNSFFNDGGLAAVFIDLNSIARPDQEGQSPWGIYQLKDYQDGKYLLYFDDLQNCFEVIETVTGELIIKTGEEYNEFLYLKYRLLENQILLDSVVAGRTFFDKNEIDYQKNTGRHFIDDNQSFIALTDLFIALFKPTYKYMTVDATWSKNRSSGNGLQLIGGGLLYQGQISDSVKNGKGVIINPDLNEFHLGNWSADLRAGEFEIYSENGVRIQANYTNNLPEGEWYFHNGLGKIEKVKYIEGTEKSRYRVRSVQTATLVSQSIDAYQFKTIYFGTEYYAGFVKDEHWYRWGKYQYDDGSYYNGQWKNNSKNGYGMFHWFDGEIYAGSWLEDEQTGWSTIYYPNGSRFDGEFKESKYHGFGVFRYNNGNIIKGNYHNGVVHGKAEVTFISGKIEEREYDFGSLIAKTTLKEADNVVGIGVSVKFDKRYRHYYLSFVGRECPADVAGLKAEDVLNRINGNLISDLSHPDVSDMIKGLPGTIVTLNIVRDGKYQDVRVIRDELRTH